MATNNDRRKLIGNVFADTAKYSLTAGVLGSIISQNFTTAIALLLGIVAMINGNFSVFCYTKK